MSRSLSRPPSRRAAVPLLAVLATTASAEDPPDPSEVEEVVVTATRTDRPRGDAPIAVEVIDREEIEASGAHTLDELLEEQPGIDLTRSFLGATVRLQGLDAPQVLVLVDGQRVIGRKGGAIDLSRYPVEMIERVEIVKGAASVLYGSDAMGGVIHIITRRAADPLSVDLYGAASTLVSVDGVATVGARTGKVATFFAAGLHHDDAYDLRPADAATSGSAGTSVEVSDRAELQLGHDLRLDARGSYLLQDLRGVDRSDSGAVFDRRNLTEIAELAAGGDWWATGSDRLRLTAFGTWYRDQYDSDQRGSDALDSYEDTRELLGQLAAQLDHAFGEPHLLTVGIEGLHERMRSDRLGPGEGDRSRGAVFAQHEWSPPGARAGVLPGIRVDADTRFGVVPTPRLAVRADPTERLTLRASYGWGYRAPSFRELLLFFENPGVGYVVAGNPDLVPEKSRNAGLGAEWQATQALWASASAFHNQLDDLITTGTLEEATAGAPTRYGYVNVARAVTRGGEANLALDTPEGLGGELGYALTDARDLTEDRPLEGRALHRGTWGLSWRHAPTTTGLMVRGSVVGPRPWFVDQDGDGVEERIDAEASTTLDVRVSQGLLRDALSLFVGVNNLTDAGDPRWLPVPPRAVYGGANLHLARTSTAVGDVP